MKLMEKLYRSPLGWAMSKVARLTFSYAKPRMIYGFEDPATGVFRKYTRMSNTVELLSPKRLAIGDHVWVWHHTILDATEGVTIGEGAQIGASVGVFTHGSENAIRLLGPKFIDIPNKERRGYTRGAVTIGQYTFVGAGSVVLPGVTLGKGSLVAAMSLVNRSFPDYAIIRGQPAKKVGDTREVDRRYLDGGDFDDTYYDPEALEHVRQSIDEMEKRKSKV